MRPFLGMIVEDAPLASKLGATVSSMLTIGPRAALDISETEWRYCVLDPERYLRIGPAAHQIEGLKTPEGMDKHLA